MTWSAIQVSYQEPVCFIRFDRPDANNTINDQLIDECHRALDMYGEASRVIVLEGSPEVFCFGGDFQGLHGKLQKGEPLEQNPESLYNLWLRLSEGPYITVSHVRGKANAGGVGFVAASDIVIADETAEFSLSELIFGLFPACVLPFLIRRIGRQKAHYMSLMTHPIPVRQAFDWGLVDAFDPQSASMLRKHLLRLRRLPKEGIQRYKAYLNELDDAVLRWRPLAVQANREVFSDQRNLDRIYRFVESGDLT